MLNRYSGILLLSLIFLIVVASRLYYVNAYAVPLPFWDQWDAEGDFLLRPWVEGRLKVTDLWEPHNEHRIFPTRLLSLLIFSVTHEWNNLTEAKINVFLAALVPATLVWALSKNRVLYGFRFAVLPVLLAQFVLPFSFENLLIGFQSQFYFLMLFTLLAAILATYRPNQVISQIGILLLCVIAIMTMGSGLLTAITVLGIYLTRILVGEKLTRQTTTMLVILPLVALLGFLLIPKIPDYDVYRASNFSELYDALTYILSWPISDVKSLALLLWSPALITIPIFIFRKKLSNADLLMTGLFIWSFLQCLAIAYGRGQELKDVSSRYTELFSLGLTANAWFAVRALEELRGYSLRWAFCLFFITFFFAHIRRHRIDKRNIKWSYQTSLTQTTNVCNYLKTNNPIHLQKTGRDIPFPDSVRLRELLDNPTIRQMLPAPMSNYIRK